MSSNSAAPEEIPGLILRSRAGDITAFESLVRRYEGLVRRLAGEILGDGATAQDVDGVTAVVFLEVWRDRRRLPSAAEFPLRLARRAVQAALRHPQHGTPHPVDGLPRGERAVVRLHFTGRYTEAEIGYLVQQSLEDVRAMLYAGCRRLAAEKEAVCTAPG